MGEFGPNRRDPQLRHRLGLSDDQPLLVYAGRLDNEKKPELVADAFQRLPAELGAKLALIGEGPLRKNIAARKDMRIIMPGYVRDRAALARWLASGDIYVSGMADETFGISIIEAQASGLPVVGVAAGAMIDRVTEATAGLARSTMPAPWPPIFSTYGMATAPPWAATPASTRFNSAGNEAWRPCSGRSSGGVRTQR